MPSAPAAQSPRRQCIFATAIPIPIDPQIVNTAARDQAATISTLLNDPRLIISFPAVPNVSHQVEAR